MRQGRLGPAKALQHPGAVGGVPQVLGLVLQLLAARRGAAAGAGLVVVELSGGDLEPGAGDDGHGRHRLRPGRLQGVAVGRGHLLGQLLGPLEQEAGLVGLREWGDCAEGDPRRERGILGQRVGH